MLTERQRNLDACSYQVAYYATQTLVAFVLGVMTYEITVHLGGCSIRLKKASALFRYVSDAWRGPPGNRTLNREIKSLPLCH